MNPEHPTDDRNRKLVHPLDDSAERTANLLDSITDGFVVLGFDWRCNYANESAARFLRKSKEELIGEDVFRAFPEGKGTVFERGFRTAMEERVTTSLEAFYEPLESWFECRCYPSPQGISVLFTDTTQRKLQEQEREVYREMVRNANSAIIRWKRDGTISFFNEFAQKLFGYTSEEMMDKHVSILVPEIESSGADLTSLVEDIVSHPERYINNVNENVCRDGRRIWMTWTNKALFDETGRVAEILAVGSDITERKITEQTLLRQKALFSGIARILHEALTCQTEEELGEVCLRVAEEITESRSGFIGEIKGQHLEEIAISNPGWDACAELEPHRHRKPPEKFDLHGIYGRVVLDGKGFFTNDPTHHPDRIGLPAGHPPLESFLGVPLIHEGRTIGMIALANRPGGYTPSEQESVETLAPVIVEAFMRKRAAQALRESEARFHRLFEDDLTGDFLCTPEGQILLCNPAFATIFGFSSSDEVVGTSILDLYVDLGERALMVEALRQQPKPWRHGAWRKRRDGELIYVVENIVGHFNDRGELFEMQGYIFDDSERKEAETRLEETGRSLESQKNLLQYIIDSARNSHLVYLDRDFNFVRVNEAYARTCGYTPQEMVGKNHFALYPHEENEAIFARVRDTGVPVEFHDKPFFFPDQPDRGTTYWDWTLTPVKDPEGAVKGLVFSLFETTQRKRMEEDLRKSRGELEQRVRERTADLEKANTTLRQYNRRLEALNKELQDFAFVASHDLAEPLRKIQTFGNMVTIRCGEGSFDEASRDYLGRMQKAAARMQNLLNSLLSYSRVTTKAEPIRDTDLRKSVKSALSNLEIMIKEKDARVEVGELPKVWADRVQMIQLFQNLIGNALKFSRERVAPHVKIYAGEAGDAGGAYEIYVEDDGIGFDERYLDKIFLPFQRLHGRSSEYEGVGMGLAICKKIVERHGGRITARSEPGKGSTFIVTLPANRKAQ
jgi:PAS domain S-box-containing protein